MSGAVVGIIALAAAGVALIAGWLIWGRPLHTARAEVAQRLEQYQRAIIDLAATSEQAKQAEALRAEVAELRISRERLAAMERAELERERAHAEQKAQLVQMGETLKQQFEHLAGETLKRAQTQFLEVANQNFETHKVQAQAGLTELLTPVRETLKRYEEGLSAVEAARKEAYGGLRQQIDDVRAGQAQVREETAKLVNALRASPKARGRWGEQQCKNVLEMAGLKDGIDFHQEVSIDGEDGKQRPDFIVHLPGGKCLVIDAKCAFNAYLDAIEATDESARRDHLAAHAAAVRRHADGLSQRGYWRQFANAPDYVVMFIPGEHFLSAALEQDSALWEWAFDKRVLLATPTNLVAIAKTVAVTWRQEKLADDARAIGELGRELYQRLAVMGEHVGLVGTHLNRAVGSYNEFVGSLESRVLSAARRFAELNVEPGRKSIASLDPVETAVREPRASELLAPRVKAAE